MIIVTTSEFHSLDCQPFHTSIATYTNSEFGLCIQNGAQSENFSRLASLLRSAYFVPPLTKTEFRPCHLIIVTHRRDNAVYLADILFTALIRANVDAIVTSGCREQRRTIRRYK